MVPKDEAKGGRILTGVALFYSGNKSTAPLAFFPLAFVFSESTGSWL